MSAELFIAEILAGFAKGAERGFRDAQDRDRKDRELEIKKENMQLQRDRLKIDLLKARGLTPQQAESKEDKIKRKVDELGKYSTIYQGLSKLEGTDPKWLEGMGQTMKTLKKEVDILSGRVQAPSEPAGQQQWDEVTPEDEKQAGMGEQITQGDPFKVGPTAAQTNRKIKLEKENRARTYSVAGISVLALSKTDATEVKKLESARLQAAPLLGRMYDATDNLMNKILPGKMTPEKNKILKDTFFLRMVFRIALSGGGNMSNEEQKMARDLIEHPNTFFQNPEAARQGLVRIHRILSESVIASAIARSPGMTDKQIIEMAKSMDITDASPSEIRGKVVWDKKKAEFNAAEWLKKTDHPEFKNIEQSDADSTMSITQRESNLNKALREQANRKKKKKDGGK